MTMLKNMLKNMLTVGASLDRSETGPVPGGEKRGRLASLSHSSRKSFVPPSFDGQPSITSRMAGGFAKPCPTLTYSHFLMLYIWPCNALSTFAVGLDDRIIQTPSIHG